MATIAAVHGGLRVRAANKAALALGIGPGLPLADARAIHPGLKTVEARPEQDAAALRDLADWLGRYSPWTAVDGADGIWIDSTGCAHLFGGEEAMMADIALKLAGLGLALRAGLADSPGAAWAAARYAIRDGDWTIIPEGAARQWLAGLPVAALRLSPTAAEGLNRLGLRRIADLLALPRAPLAARFGTEVAERLDQLLGLRGEPLSPLRPVAPFASRIAFAEPIGRTEDVAAAIRRLLEDVCARLAHAAQGARRLELALFRADGTVIRQGVGTARPVRDPAHLARLFAEGLDKLDAGFGIEAMTLTATVAEGLAAAQLGLTTASRCGELSLLVDRLGHRLGAAAVMRLAPRPGHIPEQAVVPAPPLGRLEGAWRAGPRPARLLPHPEAIEAEGEPPRRFRWRRGLHEVTRTEGPERIAAEWWHGFEPTPPAMLRDYYRVEDGQGRRFWLFRQGQGGWFLHGLFP